MIPSLRRANSAELLPQDPLTSASSTYPPQNEVRTTELPVMRLEESHHYKSMNGQSKKKPPRVQARIYALARLLPDWWCPIYLDCTRLTYHLCIYTQSCLTIFNRILILKVNISCIPMLSMDGQSTQYDRIQRSVPRGVCRCETL